MRRIERATAFRRDFRRESKAQHGAKLYEDLAAIIAVLASDAQLDPRLRDHALSGDWQGYRECHVKPDLLLIYRKTDDDLLRLARLGSHSELFKK